MEIVTLEEMKNYLRIDFNEDDILIQSLIETAITLCMDVARCTDVEKFMEERNSRIAVMYTVAYLYEKREEADHHQLNLSLRSLLFALREDKF